VIVTIGKEVFDFLHWKVVGHSFYVRRSDGELRVVALVGSGLPLRSAWFRCEFGDGTTIGFNAYKLSPLSLSEISQLQNVLQESRKGGKKGKLTTPEVRAKRSAAGRKHAKVTDAGDREKIREAFFSRANSGIISNNAAAQEVAELVTRDDNPLDLKDPYYIISADVVKRIAGVKK
jgi:hypothetical protein